MITDEVSVVLCPNYNGLGHVTRLTAIGRELQLHGYHVYLMIPPFLKQIPIFNNIWNFSLLFYSTKQHLLKLLENSIHNKLVIIEDFHPFKADLKAKSDIFISVLQTTFHQDWAKFRNNDFLIITHPFPNNKTELLSHLPRFLFEIPHVIVPPILNLYFNSQDIDVKTVRQTLGVEYGKFLFSVAGGGNFGNFLAEFLNKSLSMVSQFYQGEFKAFFMVGPHAAFYDLSGLTNLTIIPPAPSIFKYTTSADLVISQAGFQSFNEIVVSNVPAIFYPRIPEQKINLRFSHKHHFTITSTNPKKLANLISQLLDEKITCYSYYTRKYIIKGRKEAVLRLDSFIKNVLME